MSDWTDAIVGDRMTVDREFGDRVRNSRFSNQEWGLIMTATEFDIEDADDPEAARIVADTSKLPSIIPELENISNQMNATAGGGSSDGGTFGKLLGGVRDTLFGGGSGGVDAEKLEAAERLTGEYATELQRHLESKGTWEQVRISYQE
ncbi:hypothetical protein HUG10_00320 [Halorarum halophilum]|uniref:Uncharacterized protein n=1 Tax=Halorarum halophilum TaxID=2743090 RepID=A0A7D5KW46_9EURY|nr:DUF5799 family protein [Halobaculum halophilum]QLG26078.1 hypothetical protein HUG10_00320 [Halobaculum halophilum]